MGKLIASIDAGTSSNRCILFDDRGEIQSISQKPLKQYYPHPGWVEHDADEIFSSIVETISDALKKIDSSPSDIVAIGITNQRETTVVWDKTTGKPVCNAIVWQCRRTSDICDSLKAAGYTELFHKKTGLIIDAYFSGTKLKWILDNVNGAREHAERGDLLFGTIDCWVLWKLTNGKVHATDYSNASRTMMFNINSLEWDDEILDILDIPKCMLPEVKPSSGLFGYAESLGNIPITGIAGDQQAALFGQTCFKKGDLKNTYGTGCFMLMNIGREPIFSNNGLLTTIAWGLNNEVYYALEGSVFNAGSAVQWIRDEMGLIKTADESEDLAKQVDDTNGCYFVPAFTGLGAPYWDQDARGVIVGITRGTNRNHIVRATLESIAYQTSDILEVMKEDSNMEIESIYVDGGASVNNVILQEQANIIDIPVIRPQCIESTALGAAYLAGLGAGIWKDIGEISDNKKIDRVFESKITDAERSERLAGWHDAVKRSLNQG